MAETFWSSLPPEDRQALRAAGRVQRYPRGAVLCRQGQPAGRVFVLVSGLVEVTRDGATGHRTVLARRGSGDVIGELSAVDERPMSATVTAMVPTTALILPAARFAEVCRARGEIFWHMMTTVTTRLRDSDTQRARFRVKVRDRVVLALLELAAVEDAPVEGPGRRLELQITQQDLADQIGASLVAVTRALEELRQLQVIDTGRGRIIVPDAARLAGTLPAELS